MHTSYQLQLLSRSSGRAWRESGLGYAKAKVVVSSLSITINYTCTISISLELDYLDSWGSGDLTYFHPWNCSCFLISFYLKVAQLRDLQSRKKRFWKMLLHRQKLWFQTQVFSLYLDIRNETIGVKQFQRWTKLTKNINMIVIFRDIWLSVASFSGAFI